jgi:hypothetical protein
MQRCGLHCQQMQHSYAQGACGCPSQLQSPRTAPTKTYSLEVAGRAMHSSYQQHDCRPSSLACQGALPRSSCRRWHLLAMHMMEASLRTCHALLVG